jgi:hypothetical protein
LFYKVNINLAVCLVSSEFLEREEE